VRYPTPGDPDLARRVQKMLAPLPVTPHGSAGRAEKGNRSGILVR
jgi:hypothetical protein